MVEVYALDSGDLCNLDNSLVLGGDRFDIGTRVIKWNEELGFNGYVKKRVVVQREDRKTGKVKTKVIQGPRYRKRKKGLRGISQFFIHHSGGDGKDAGNCYRTLYMERGLSVQFFVDDDGTIWQFNDALDCCYHAGAHNDISVGVECALFPIVAKKPNYYSPARRKRTGNLPHKKRVETIHGRKYEVFCFPPPQVDALARLAAGTWLAIHIQRLEEDKYNSEFEYAPSFPRNTRGKIPRTVISKPKSHRGLIGHLQCTKRKVDPMGFPWEQFEAMVTMYFNQFWTEMFYDLEEDEC